MRGICESMGGCNAAIHKRTSHEVDEILTVATDEAKAMARQLAREEAIFAASSTGANVVASLRMAERLGPPPP